MKYYVYRLDDPITKEFYFGSRQCKCDIENDPYMGSMSTWSPDKSKLIKSILKSDFENRETALQYESNIIKENIKHPLNRNYHVPNKGFCGGKKGPKIKHHPFSNQTHLKKFKKHYKIRCNKNGSNLNWNQWKRQVYEFEMYLYGMGELPNIDTRKIPTFTKKVGKLLFSIPEYVTGMKRP